LYCTREHENYNLRFYIFKRVRILKELACIPMAFAFLGFLWCLQVRRWFSQAKESMHFKRNNSFSFAFSSSRTDAPSRTVNASIFLLLLLTMPFLRFM